MKRCLALLLLCAPAHAAEERAADFASSARIEAQAAASHYRVQLSAPVYRATAQRSLGDLRVTNADGEFVPFAFAPRESAPAAAPESRALKLFPLYGSASHTSVEGLSLRVERSAAGTVVKLDTKEAAPRGTKRKLLGYIAEFPELPRPLHALAFDWTVQESFTGAVRIEASEDLERWRTLLARAPLIRLEHAGERLERKRVELPLSSARYLRLSFIGVPADFALAAVRGELRGEKPDPVRESLSVAGRQDAEKKNEYQFDTGGAFPVDRVRIALPQANTIAPVQILARHRSEDAWRPLASTSVYRLSREGSEILSPDVALGAATDRYWLLRVDARAGGLGGGEVALVVSWLPHEIVFAARGKAPFSLLAGSRTAKPANLPLATIVPGYREGEAVAAARARLGEVVANAQSARKADDPVAALRELFGSGEGRKWMLWAVLVAGVLLVIWMATRLMRDLGKAAAAKDEGAQKTE